MGRAAGLPPSGALDIGALAVANPGLGCGQGGTANRRESHYGPRGAERPYGPRGGVKYMWICMLLGLEML